MRRIWLLLALLAPAIASAAPGYYGWGAGAFLQGPEAGTCVSNNSAPSPGDTISISGCPAFSGSITTLTSPTGDTITAEGGASTTAADFVIPDALTAFISGGSMQDTEWGISGTWTIGDGSTTEEITLTIESEQSAGPTHFFGTVTTPIAGDSVFPSTASPTDGDEYYVAVVSGSGVSVNPNGSTSASTDYELNATIWDESENGGLGRWSGVENTSFDSTPPAFSSAVIASNGTTFTLTLDEAASQGAGYNDSDVTLSCSGGAATLTALSGDGTTDRAYTTSRTIEPGETCTTSFNGDANSLEDAVGNDVASFSGESVTNNSSSDVTPPAYVSSSIDAAGTLFTLTTDEAVTQGAGYADSDLTLTCSGGAATLTYSAGDGTTTPDYAISRTIEPETCTISFDGSANSLEDGAGNDLPSFTGQSVTNNSTADVTSPLFVSAAIDSTGDELTVTFDEAASQGAGYSDSDFTVTASGGAVTVTYSSGDTTTAHVLTLSRTIDQDEVVTLDWAGTANGLEDAAGNDVAAFSDESVTNNSEQDLTPPVFVSARINGSTLIVVYSDVMTSGAGGTAGHAIASCSGGAVTPTYVSGTGSRQLVFSLSREPDPSETGCVLGYTQPTNGWENTEGNDLATFSGQAISIRSACVQTIGSVIGSVTGPSVRALQCVR